MIRRPPRSTQSRSSAASDVYKRQVLGNPNFYQDPNSGRPARILSWSIGVQREVLRDLVVEANYVGNRGAWENNGASLGGLNTPNPTVFSKYGIDPTTTAGQQTL